MIKPTNPTALIREMRSIGESMLNKGMIEFDLTTGEITWCNEFALNKTGYESPDQWAASIFNVIPNEFHNQLRKHITNIISNKEFGISIWPIETVSGEISWWYTYQTKTQYPIRWSFL